MNAMIPFQSTVWAEIDRARDRDPAAYLQFVNRYRPAVVSFLRTQGFSSEDAEDLAQEVFLLIVRHDVLERVDPKKGKFRSLILAVTKNVARNTRRDRSRQKRGGDAPQLSLDQSELPVAAPESSEEQERFDRMWSQQLVAIALRELSSAHAHYYRALRLMLDGKSHQEIAQEMGKTANEVNNYVHRAKSWIGRTVRRLIVEYCASDAEFKDELRHLSKFLSDDRPV
jgi:RNA polymerase sigma-70 factor (ECF subfamily)